MDEILVALLRRRADVKPIKITTSELGAELGMSQQNASRRLAQLEAEGSIERGKEGIRLTTKGREELASLFATMKSVFEKGRIEIEGTITSGLGEGKYYLSLSGYREQIKKKLGFTPYPGTLNIRIGPDDGWKKQSVLRLDPVIISGFQDKGRTFGDLFAYRCRLDKLECAVVVPLRTHHGADIIEVICPFCIKKKLGLADGDSVRVVV